MTTETTRPVSFETAKRQFVHRFTMEHTPNWAKRKHTNGKFYAPQFSSDREWYDNTKFYGESELATKNNCYTTGQTFPLGQWLTEPYWK